jgi:hypothetical protein
VVVYQAFPEAIAKATLAAGRFVAPFSFERMSWIKPSFLWLMSRSNWGRKSGQEHTLAIRIRHDALTEALSLGVLTHFEPRAHVAYDKWEQQFSVAPVHIQWDPERSLSGATLNWDTLQIGLGRGTVRRYADDWVVSIADMTERVRRIHALLREGRSDQAKRLLPPERVYPIQESLRTRLGMLA